MIDHTELLARLEAERNCSKDWCDKATGLNTLLERERSRNAAWQIQWNALQTRLCDIEAALWELRKFIQDVTLELQQHRSRSDKQKDQLFQRAYSLYVKYDVDKIDAEIARRKFPTDETTPYAPWMKTAKPEER